MVEFTIEVLLTVPGIAALVGLLLQIIKPALKKKVATPEYYSLIMNGIAIAIGIVAAIAAQAVFSLDYESILSAVLTGIGGASLATLGYESVDNLFAAVRAKRAK